MEPRVLKLPPAFIRDCLESDCDVGAYAGGRLTATPGQLQELRSRASFYASPDGPDQQPPGLRAAAKALLRALPAE